MTQSVASLSAVSKRYLLGSVVVNAVDNISVDIPPDRFTVLSGPSGSGKTTLLNLIGCIDKPDTGRIVVSDQDVTVLNDNQITDFRARNIGFIFQNFNLLPVFSAYENIEYPLLIEQIQPSERRERIQAMLKAVGLEAHAYKRPNQLSGGQQQRVAIARALIKRPALVLADEPTANLDTVTSRAIIELMRQMQADLQASFVFSSHDPRVLAEADTAILIQDGKLVDVKQSH